MGRIREEATKSCEICDELFRLWANFMPDWIELPADYGIERAEVYVLDIQIVKVKL